MMHKCPKCVNGKVTVTAVHITLEGRREDPPMTFNCPRCDGTGEVTDKQLEIINFEDNMWCKCEEHPDMNVKHYQDGEHPEIYKHHYRCNVCQGVVQMG